MHFLNTIECCSDFCFALSKSPYIQAWSDVFPILNVRDVFLDCLDLIFVFFKTPASRSRAYCDCNPIREFETFDISREPISKASRSGCFWYKRGCNWLGAIKGMALWSRGFSRGSLFKTWPKPEIAHEKLLTPRITSFSSPTRSWSTSFFIPSLSGIPRQRTESFASKFFLSVSYFAATSCNTSVRHFPRYIFQDRGRYNQITWLERNKSSWTYFTAPVQLRGD